MQVVSNQHEQWKRQLLQKNATERAEYVIKLIDDGNNSELQKVLEILRGDQSYLNDSAQKRMTPLEHAAFTKNCKAAALLLQHVAEVITQKNLDKAFFTACQFNSIEIIKLLLEQKKVNVNVCDVKEIPN